MAENSEVARRQLTRQLRDLRNAAGLTMEQAAKELEWSLSKLSRIEKGETGLRGIDAKNMCELYGRPDMGEKLAKLAKAAKSKPWYHEYGDVIPEWFDVYIGLEESAATFRWYESELVPGMFQTEDYARTLVRIDNPSASDEQIDRRVQLRLKRQTLLTRTQDPQQWHIVLPEAVLHRPVGGKPVMLDQLDHLQEVTELPNVTLGVIPVDAGMHHGILSGPFVLLDFPKNGNGQPVAPTTVYIEGLTGAIYTDDENQVDRYRVVFDGIQKASLSPVDSKDLIAQAIKEMKRK